MTSSDLGIYAIARTADFPNPPLTMSFTCMTSLIRGAASPFFSALFMLATVSSPLVAQDATHPVKPFLWKIEGPALQKPSYLFGTIHLSSPEMKDLHPAAEKAFTSADALFTEIPMDPKSQRELMPTLIRADGKTLDESVGDTMAAALNAEMKAIQPELSSVPFQSMKTWVMLVSLPLLKSQLQGQKALDAILWNRATEAGKKLAGLETIASQTGIFEKFTESEINVMLASTLKQLKEAREGGDDISGDLLAAYISGDEEKVTGEMDKSARMMARDADPELGKRFLKLLLTDRNVTMASTIDEKLKAAPDQVNFFAVGTGHLVGKDSIVTLLSGKGYQITRTQD